VQTSCHYTRAVYVVHDLVLRRKYISDFSKRHYTFWLQPVPESKTLEIRDVDMIVCTRYVDFPCPIWQIIWNANRHFNNVYIFTDIAVFNKSKTNQYFFIEFNVIVLVITVTQLYIYIYIYIHTYVYPRNVYAF